MTREEALVAVTMLVEAYPRDVAPTTLKAYALHLVDLDRETTLEAIQRLVRTSKWLPTVAELRKAEAEVRFGPAPTVDEAWSEALGMLSHGHYGPALDVSPLVGRTLALLGARHELAAEPVHYLRLRFYDAYQRVVEQVQTSAAIGSLPPWAEDRLGLNDGRVAPKRIGRGPRE